MSAWMKTIVLPFLKFEHETSLVRMFRIEYNREYEELKKGGYIVDETFVKGFLKNQKFRATT